MIAALALAAALLTPVPPQRRLAAPTRANRGRLRWPLAAGCAAGCLVVVVLATFPLATGVAAAELSATAGVRYRGRVRRSRGVGAARALEAALDVLVGELRIGAHPVRAFEAAAAETEHPYVAAGLRAVAARARLGADVAAGLRAMAAASPLPAHWQRLALYWELGCEHGLAISTLMQAAQRDIAERQRFSDRVDSSMAGARASATILAALPAAGVLLGQLIGAGPLGFLVGGSGGLLLVIGVTLMCAGLLWADRITGRCA